MFVAFVALAPLGCSGPTLAPTPNLYWTTGVNPFDEVPEVYRTPDVEMLYATDRAPEEKPDGSLRYGYKRSHSLAMGLCTTRIGREGMTWEALVEASTVRRRPKQIPMRVTSIDEIARLPASNTPRVLVDGEFEDGPEYLAELASESERFEDLVRERLAMTPLKDVFLFVHGFNNTFEQAAIRMSTLWHFLGRQGVPIFYSWPAGHPGLLQGYNYDRESSEFTVYHLKQLCRAISDVPEVERIHIIAHSRGTDVALNALRELWIEFRASGGTRPEKLSNMIIAAADIDWEVLQQRITAERLPSLLEAWVFYLSEEDKAIGLSSWLFSSLARVGRLEMKDLSPQQRENIAASEDIQVIDVKVKSGFVGHAYFIDNPAVLSDLILVLRHGKGIGAENGRPLKRKKGEFWTLDDSYLVPEN